MDISQVLVAILASALAVFLALGIALLIMLVRIGLQIRRITNSAERTALTFENIMSGVQKAAAPAIISKFVLEQIKRFAVNQTKKNKSEKE